MVESKFKPGVGGESKKTKIYTLCDANGEVRYIGKTVATLRNRLSGHLFEARHGWSGYRSNWIRTMLAVGEVPAICLLEEVDGNGYECEVAWIKKYRQKGAGLTNMTDGGEGTVGRIVSEETRAKLRAIRKLQPSPMKGKHHTLEARKHYSDACKKHPNNFKGKHHSEDTKAKLRIARALQPSPMKGKHLSLETRKRIGDTLKIWYSVHVGTFLGKHHTPEARLKMRIAKLKLAEENQQSCMVAG